MKNLFFHKIWKAYLEWYTSALGVEYPISNLTEQIESYTYLALFYAPYVMWCLFLESMQTFVIHILYDSPYHLSCAWEWNALFYVNRDIKLVETRDRYHVPSYAMLLC